MSKYLLLLLSISSFLDYSEAGRVQPYGPTPISLSCSNAGQYADYNFTMQLDNSISSDGVIEITFPLQQYDLGLGLSETFTVYAPYPQTCPCTLTTTDTDAQKSIVCNIGERLANQSFTVSVLGVQNPLKVGGTGMFKIISRYSSTDKIMDFNYNFGVIGLYSAPLTLADASISPETGYSELAGEVSNWIISFTPVDDLPALIDVKIVFPPELFDFSSAQTYQCEADTSLGSTLSGTIQCEFSDDFKNLITFVGNNQTISKGTVISLRMKNFYNPTRALTSNFFMIYIQEKSTNNTIQQREGVPGLIIQPGVINDVSLSSRYTAFPLYTSAIREMILSFRPSNPFNSVRIATNFPLINSCNVIYGLFRQDLKTSIVCSAISNVITITGFETYEPEDIYLKIVQVSFFAVLPNTPQTLDPVEIYTYLDSVFLLEVDQNVTALNTRLQIIQGPSTVMTESTLAASNQNPLGSGTLTFTVQTVTTYTAPNQIVIEIGDIFYGIPTCEFTTKGGSAVSVTCTYSNGIITAVLTPSSTTSPYNIDSTGNNLLAITGLSNPYATTTYPFRLYVYGNGPTYTSIPNEYGAGSFTINQLSSFTASGAFLARNKNSKSPFILSITPPLLLFDGYQNAEEAFKESSEILVNFNVGSASGFYYDLGYSSMGLTLQDLDEVYCAPDLTSGFGPSVYSSNIKCDILLGPSTGATSTSFATVRIRDFTGVLAGVPMKISIPIYTPDAGSTPTVTVYLLYQKQNEEYTIASQVVTGSNMVSYTSPSTATASLTSVTATLDIADTQSIATLTITFSIGGTIAVANDNSIVITYPNDYSIDLTNSVFSIGGSAIDPRYINIYSDLSYLTILITTSLSGSQTIIITNVNTPSAKLISNTLQIQITSNYDYAYQSASVAITALIPGIFSTVTTELPTMSVIHTELNHPYATYQFNFTTTKNVTSSDQILIIFPFSLFPSNFGALAYCDNMLGLKNLSDTTRTMCTFSGSTATVSQFQDIDIGTDIQITIYGVTNPSSDILGQAFTISVQDTLSQVIEENTITASATVALGPAAFSVQDLNVTIVRMVPNNAILYGTMSFYMDPGFELPKNSNITVTFPPGFALYSNSVTDTQCLADGGLYVVTRCTTNPDLNFIMLTGERSNKDIPITLYYVGYSKYSSENTFITGFQIEVQYESQVIAQSDPTKITNFTTGEELIGSMNINVALDFYPQNEGEQANYLFTFDTTNIDTIFADMMFFVRFPADYDPKLALYNIAVASDDLDGALHFFLIGRDLRITGFYEKAVTGNITIRVWGVVNPNRYDNTQTDYFLAGIIQDDEMLYGNDKIEGIIPLLAPDGISLTTLSSTISNSRYLDSFTFTFLPRQNIKSSALGGILYIDFPPDYLIDSYGGKCTINKAFSFFVNCILDYNRIWINSTNEEWNPDVNGALTSVIENIRDPDDNGSTHAFVIGNYDSLNKKVLGRTYNTLNPASLDYTYDGELISVNDDLPVIVEIGTYTDEIEITLPGPSQQTLTLTPNVLNPDILIVPFPLKIELDQTSVKFRVAAPRTILQQSFYITWAKTGDAYVPTYAPLRRTELVMKKGYYVRTVTFESMEYIPQDGVSYPLELFTNNPPYEELNVNLTLLNLDTQVYFDTLQLEFSQGQFSAYFSMTVDVAHPLTNVKIQFSLDGYDSESYQMPYDEVNKVYLDTLEVPVVAPETSTPNIISITTDATTKTTATITIEGTTLAFIYYVFGNRGMLPNSFQGTQNATYNETLEYSNPIYNVTYLKLNPRTVTFTISDLSPGIEYVLYAYIMNLNRIYNLTYAELSFKTLSPDKPAEFIMMINQISVSSDLKQEYFVRIAAMISIPKARVIEKTTDCVQEQIGLFYSQINTTFIHTYILPDPTNDYLSNTPLALANKLNERVSEIQAFITRLADGDLLQVQEVPENIPEWGSRPAWVDADTGSMSFTVKVNQCGYIKAVAVPVLLSRNNTASNQTIFEYESSTDIFVSSYQIWSELNSTNQPAYNTSIRVNDLTQEYTLNVSGLADKLIYHIFITTENDWPAYNLLQLDTQVARIEAKTIKIRKPLNIYSENVGTMIRASILFTMMMLMTILS